MVKSSYTSDCSVASSDLEYSTISCYWASRMGLFETRVGLFMVLCAHQDHQVASTAEAGDAESHPLKKTTHCAKPVTKHTH
jgi:hypothetical protein